MVKALSIVLMAVLVLNFTSFAFAKTPGDKLIRGVGNVFSGWLEVPKNIDKEWKASKNAGIGIFAGIIKGLCLGLGRTASGIWDAVTFPVSIPKDYEPFFKPDYVFDKE